MSELAFAHWSSRVNSSVTAPGSCFVKAGQGLLLTVARRMAALSPPLTSLAGLPASLWYDFIAYHRGIVIYSEQLLERDRTTTFPCNVWYIIQMIELPTVL